MPAAFFAASMLSAGAVLLVPATASAQGGDPAPPAAAAANVGHELAGKAVPALTAAASPAAAPPPGASAPSPPVMPVTQLVSSPIAAWSVPEGCPDAGVVDARARSLAALDVATWVSAGSVRGRIVGEAGGWVLSLEIERASGGSPAPASAASAGSASVSSVAPARVFHAANCSELGEAAAVAIALALGGAAAEPARATEPAADRLPAPPADTSRDAAGDAAEDASGAALASELRSLGGAARAEAVVDTGSLGGVALGASAEVGVRWRALGVRAYGLGLPSRQVRLAPSQSVELSLWAAGLRGCYRAVDGLPLLDVCGGAEVGAFGAAGRGLVDARERRDAWGATTWGTWLGVDLAEHLQAGARLEAVVPLSRERYLVNRNELVHEMSGPSLRLALSLGGTLGSD